MEWSGTGGADVSAQMCKQRRVVATDRPQTGVVGQVATARRETTSRRHEIPSGRCDVWARNNSSRSGRRGTARNSRVWATRSSGVWTARSSSVWTAWNSGETARRRRRGRITSGRRRLGGAEQQRQVWAARNSARSRGATENKRKMRPPRGGAEQRETARSRGRSGRRGAAASGVGANNGELPSERRRNTVWTAKYRLDLTRNNSRSASSTVRQVRQGQRAAGREGQVPLTE